MDWEIDEVLEVSDVVMYVFCVICKSVNIRNFEISIIFLKKENLVKLKLISVIGNYLFLVYCSLFIKLLI